ncbi:MAG TPA: OsmC family protein [Verrucomicrobiae bacterium]|jgi:putative redox protein|nr:OsmC family protein [Verrucomicrobiae bacterium]
MVNIDLTYEGGLHCRLKHGPSGMEIVTDAPKDNMGKGAAFSPTDLTTASLGACMMTLMGIYAQRHGIELAGTKAQITKEMASDPRRIARVTVVFKMAAGIPADQRPILERAALTCPVHKSLHPDIDKPVRFDYPD